jgi:hypothetical protein
MGAGRKRNGRERAPGFIFFFSSTLLLVCSFKEKEKI